MLYTRGKCVNWKHAENLRGQTLLGPPPPDGRGAGTRVTMNIYQFVGAAVERRTIIVRSKCLTNMVPV